MTNSAEPHYVVLEQKLRLNATLLRLWLLSGAAATALAAVWL